MPEAPTEDAAPALAYRDGLAHGRLLYQRCAACARAQFYPRVLCVHCGGVDLAWHESVGRGTVYATSAVHERGADPRNVALVDLDDGFRMMSTVVGVPAEAVRIGDPVRARIVRDPDTDPIVVFETAVPA